MMTFGGRNQSMRWNRPRTFYDDPSFTRAERTLRTRQQTEARRVRHQYLRGGANQADLPRLMTNLRVAQQRATGNLVGNQMNIEQERKRRAAERRKGRLGRILGFATRLPFQIASMNIMRKAYNPMSAIGAAASTAAPSMQPMQAYAGRQPQYYGPQSPSPYYY